MTQLNTTQFDITRRPPIIPDFGGLTHFERRILDREAEKDAPGIFGLIGAGFSSGTAIPFALRALERRGFSVDASFNPFTDDEVFKQLTEGLDRGMWSGFDRATNMAQALVIRDQLLDIQESRNIIARAGLKGMVVAGLTMALDPAFVVAGALSFGALSPFVFASKTAQLSRTIRFLHGGVLVAPSEVAIQAFITDQDPEGDVLDIALAGAGAFVLGGAADVVLGRATRKAARRIQKRSEFTALAQVAMGAAGAREFAQGARRSVMIIQDARAMRELMEKVLTPEGKIYFKEMLDPNEQRRLADEFIDGLDADDAMKADLREIDPVELVDAIDSTRSTDADELMDVLTTPATQQKVPKAPGDPDVPDDPFPRQAGDLFINVTDAISRWTPVRWSIAGRLGSARSSPLMRMFASATVEDALRKLDGSANASNASMGVERMHRGNLNDYRNAQNTNWRKWAEANGVGVNNAAKYEEFNRLVGMTVRRLDDEHAARNMALGDTGEGAEYVVAMARESASLRKPILERMQRHGVKGSREVEYRSSYMSRMWSVSAINRMSSLVGDDNLHFLLVQALMDGAEDMTQEAAEKLAPGFLAILRRTDDPNVIHRARIFDQTDREVLRDVLRDVSPELADRQVDEILGLTTKPGDPEKGVTKILKRRIKMDETTFVDVKGKDGTIRRIYIEDLLENNDQIAFEIYSRQASGATAMAEALRAINVASGGRRATPGGTAKPFESMDEVVSEIRRQGASDKDMERVDVIVKSLRGQALGKDTKFANALRRLRIFQQLRVGEQVGLASFPEFANIFASGGFVAMLQQMPALRQMFRRLADGTSAVPIVNEIESIGISINRKLDNVASRMDEGDAIIEFGNRGAFDRGLRRLGKFGNDINFITPITIFQQRFMAIVAEQKFANIARGSRKLGKKRMQDLGLDDAMTDRISAMIRKHGKFANDSLTGGRMIESRFNSWAEDPEAASAFIEAITRWTSRSIQSQNIGNLSLWMTTDMGRVIVQYRSFTLTAWEKQFLQKLDMRDWQAFAEMTGSVLIAGMVYTAQQHMNAIGRDDKEEFLKRQLGEGEFGFDPWVIARKAAQRAGFTSIIPSILDSIWESAGQTPMFNARNTGLQRGVIGNPTFDFVESLLKAPAPFVQALQGEPFTQSKAHKIANLLPFKDTVGIKNMTNALISQFPED